MCSCKVVPRRECEWTDAWLVIDVETVFRERCLSTIQMPSQNATVSLRKEFHRQKTFTYGLLHNCAFQGTYHKYEFKEEKVKRSW